MTGRQTRPVSRDMAIARPRRSGLLMLKPTFTPGGWIDARSSPPFPTRSPTERRPPRPLRMRFPGSRAARDCRQLDVPVAADRRRSAGRLDLAFCRIPVAAAAHSALQPRARPARAGTRRRSAARLLGQATTQDVFIAHELYHHIEATRSDTPIARRHQATLFRIGSWQWRTGIATLAEIAAGAFAQSLLDLPCHPKVLDYVAGPLH